MKIKDFYHKKGVEKGVENWISEILDFCLTRETIDFTRFFGERETGFEHEYIKLLWVFTNPLLP